MSDPTIIDTRGRALRDLRLSVTDRCNFRCTYCMPKTVFGRDYRFLPHRDLLSFEEITRLVKIFATLGTNKIRLTGGEPLLRKHIEHLVDMLSAIPDIDLTLTTNGALLAQKAKDLKAAGLRRLTVSLDSLNDETFRLMNDADFSVAQVLDGIDTATAIGFEPAKINMVVKRGINDQGILPMARHFKGSGHIVRFIEYMDVGTTNGWRLDDVVPSAEVVRLIHAEMPLEPIGPNYPGEVAERWRYRDGSGEIGVISSVSQAFCHSCTRTRLSAEGKLYTCLFANVGHDLRALLRSNHTDTALKDVIQSIWNQRADHYSEIRHLHTHELKKIEMSYIGG